MSVIFPFAPNWEGGITETEDWLTDILQAWDGTEQRATLREPAGHTLEFEVVTFDAQELAWLQNLLTGSQERVWGVPWWPDASLLSASLPSGSTSISAATSGKAYESGAQALLWAGPRSCEAVTVSTVGASALTVSATAATWPAGTVLLPVREGRLTAKLDLDQLTDAIVSASLHFDCREEL